MSYGQVTRAYTDFGSVAVGSHSLAVPLTYHVDGLSVAPFVSVNRSGDFTMSGPLSCGDPNNCVLPLVFSPHAPGLRQGSVVVKDALSSRVLAVTPLVGIGASSEVSFLPGIVSVVIGLGPPNGYGLPSSGPAKQVTLRTPTSLTFDPAGDLFVADRQSNMVLKYTVGTGNVSIIAGTGRSGYTGDGHAASQATLNAPSGIAVDSAGNLYIADTGNNVIRMVGAETQVISTFAGAGSNYGIDGLGDGGPAKGASLNNPSALLLDRQGNVYVSDTGNNLVRKIDLSGTISIFAGSHAGSTFAGGNDGLGDGGDAAGATLNKPAGLAWDPSGTHLYVADAHDNLVRVVDLINKGIAVFAGSAGAPGGLHGDGLRATAATLNNPEALAVDPAGNLYIADSGNYTVRRVDAISGIITTAAGTGISPGYASGGLRAACR
jgi:sugar lactone lactonase YvrE